jgi:2-C-methyl-D-erythritol 2,4-cyclodiphosphate synthase
VRSRVGLGFDVHRFSDDAARPLVLGGVTIDGPGLEGHSDADVVAHAVADAVLGAAGLDDLGTLFPASDERYRGVSSIALLAEVAGRVAATRWWIVNVDVVVAAERPTVGPYTAEMAENVTGALKAAREPMGEGVHVSVKAKRAEGLGAIGRAEGIGAWAVALLDRG